MQGTLEHRSISELVLHGQPCHSGRSRCPFDAIQSQPFGMSLSSETATPRLNGVFRFDTKMAMGWPDGCDGLETGLHRQLRLVTRVLGGRWRRRRPIGTRDLRITYFRMIKHFDSAARP